MKKIIILILGLCFLVNILEEDEDYIVRVIASSNNEEDIELKEEIFKDIIFYINSYSSLSPTELEDILKSNISDIEQILIAYDVEYLISFKDMSLHKYDNSINTKYHGIEITINQGEGTNCWCNLYKEHCNILGEEITYKSYLKQLRN